MCCREEAPLPPVFVVAGDCLEEWIERILESRLAKKGDCVLEMFRGFLLRCGSWRLAIARADVRFEAMAFSLRLGPDAIDGRGNDIGVVLDLRLDGRDRDRGRSGITRGSIGGGLLGRFGDNGGEDLSPRHPLGSDPGDPRRRSAPRLLVSPADPPIYRRRPPYGRA